MGEEEERSLNGVDSLAKGVVCVGYASRGQRGENAGREGGKLELEIRVAF